MHPQHTRPLPTLTATDVARFWSHVTKSDGCWIWTANPKQRQPQMEIKGRPYGVPRLAYHIAYGALPAGLLVCHHCDNPRCVRADHLFLGTPADNIADRDRKERQARGARHGTHTHPEQLPLGMRNGRHTQPERTARAERHGARLHPESLPRGERHGFYLHPERAPRGERNRHAKLSQQQVDDVRGRRRAGERVVDLAREYGVNESTIHRIIRGATWRDG